MERKLRIADRLFQAINNSGLSDQYKLARTRQLRSYLLYNEIESEEDLPTYVQDERGGRLVPPIGVRRDTRPLRDEHFKPRIRDGELSVNSDPAELIRTVNVLKSGLKKRMRSVAPVGKASYDFFEGILQRNGG